jgi:fatty acid amide hydrolase 2
MLQKLEKLRHQIIHALGKNGILLLPTWPTLAPFHNMNIFTPFNLELCQLINVLGFPSLACPLGLDSATGMPVGVQIVGPPNSESMLMAAGKELEKGFGGWVRP